MASRLNQLHVEGIDLIGFSLAGEETVVAAPELNVCFDIGRAPREVIPIDHVLLTHGHMDHAAGLAYYFYQRDFIGNEPGTILLPKRLAQPARAIMAAWADLEGHHAPGAIVGLDAGEDYQLRRGLIARPFAVRHGTPALGYSVVETRHKLKPEHHDKGQHELVALKKQGVEIEYTLEVPLIAFCGDTAAGDFFDLPHVKQAKILIIEATFLEPEHVHRARAGNHLHATDLPEILDGMENDAIVISHMTRRTGVGYAKKILRKLLPAEVMAKTHFLMDRPRAKHDED